jgi:membrane-associated phospholipid phosphatase
VVLAWPAATAIAYLSAFGLVYYASVRTARGRLVSDASLRGAILSGGSFRNTVDAILDLVSVGSLLGAVMVVAGIGLLRNRARGVAAVAVLVTANVSTWLLKDHLLARPDLGLDEVAPATMNSLPSGHTTAAFSAVAALVLVLPGGGRSPAALLGGSFAAVVALATMFAGWHRAADSMAAFLVVGTWTMVAISVLVLSKEPDPGRSGRRRSRWSVPLAAVVFALGVTSAMGLSMLGPVRDTATGSLLAFSSAALLVVGTLLAVLISMLRVLEATDAQAGEDAPT